MRKFKITFERTVRERDRCTRTFEARDETHARLLADAAASCFDDDCPVSGINVGIHVVSESWEVEKVEPVGDGEDVDDLPLGIEGHLS